MSVRSSEVAVALFVLGAIIDPRLVTYRGESLAGDDLVQSLRGETGDGSRLFLAERRAVLTA